MIIFKLDYLKTRVIFLLLSFVNYLVIYLSIGNNLSAWFSNLIKYEKILLLICIHHFDSDVIYNMDHMRISRT